MKKGRRKPVYKDRRKTDDKTLEAARLLHTYHLTVKQMKFTARLKYAWFILKGLTGEEKDRIRVEKLKKSGVNVVRSGYGRSSSNDKG